MRRGFEGINRTVPWCRCSVGSAKTGVHPFAAGSAASGESSPGTVGGSPSPQKCCRGDRGLQTHPQISTVSGRPLYWLSESNRKKQKELLDKCPVCTWVKSLLWDYRLSLTSFSGINLLGPLPKGLGILTPKSCKRKKGKHMQFKYHRKAEQRAADHHFSFLMQTPPLSLCCFTGVRNQSRFVCVTPENLSKV